MSYYKFAERSAKSQVDWGTISKDMIEMLRTQNTLRETNLDKAIKDQNEISSKLSSSPMGQDRNANDQTAQFATDGQEYMLMMNRLWKSGEVSYREYMSSINNFRSNATSYLDIRKNYNKAFDVHVKRLEDNTAGNTEVEQLAWAEGIGNYNEYSAIIDAPTGNISLARTVDGELKNHASMATLNNIILGTYNRFDMNEALSDEVDALGRQVLVINKYGVLTEEGLKKDKEFNKAATAIVKGSLSKDDNSYTSVLNDYLSADGYVTSNNIDEALNDSTKILMVPDPRNPGQGPTVGYVESMVSDDYIRDYVAQLGKSDADANTLIKYRSELRALSEQTVKDNLFNRLDLIQTPTPKWKPTDPTPDPEGYAKFENEKTMVESWHELGTAKEAKDRDSAAENIVGLNNKGLDPKSAKYITQIITEVPGEVTIVRGDAQKRTVIMNDSEDKEMSATAWQKRGSEITGVGDKWDRYLNPTQLADSTDSEVAGSFNVEYVRSDKKYEESYLGGGYDLDGKALFTSRQDDFQTKAEGVKDPIAMTPAIQEVYQKANIDDLEISVIEGGGKQNFWFGDENLLKIQIPSIMDNPVFLSGGANFFNQINQLNSLLINSNLESKKVTEEQIKAAIGEDYDKYNTDEIRGQLEVVGTGELDD